MKKTSIIFAFILCLLLCACSSKTLVNGCEITVEPCEWPYQNGKGILDSIAVEIGEESEAWNKYNPHIVFPRNNDNQNIIFTNGRLAVVYSCVRSSGKIINVKDFYPDQFKTQSDEISLYKHGLRFDFSKNERYTMMSSSIDGLPIYVFDNEKGTAKKITLSKPKLAFFIEDSLYICFADIDRYLGEAMEYPDSVVAKEYTTSVLYDPQSGKIERTQFANRKTGSEPPDLNGYANIGDISSHIDTFIWDGALSKDVVTELNNTDPYKVRLFLYNTTDKTYCTEVINVFDLVQ